MRYLGDAPGHRLASEGVPTRNFQQQAGHPARAMHRDEPTAQEYEAAEAMMGKMTEHEAFEDEQATYEYEEVPEKEDEDEDDAPGEDERAYARAGLPVP